MKDFKDSKLLYDILNNLPHYIFWKDRDLVFKGCNKKFAQQFGFKDTNDVIGKTDYDFGWATKLREKYNADDIQIMATGQAMLDYEEEQKQPDGSIKTVLVSKVPLYDKNQKIIGLLGIYTDISARKKMEEELKSAKERAEAANKAKAEFLQNMEHDLRTPSSGIAQMLQILEEKESDPEKKEIMGYLAKASQQLLELLNSILEFDEMSKFNAPVTLKKINTRELISNIIDIEYPAAQAKNIDISYNCASNVPKIIIGDKTKIYRILLNLVSNAVKFTSTGFVTINIEIEKNISNKEFILKFIIRDSGIGIPDDKQDIIFDRFTRCIPANHGTYPGSGLGLSIVKQLVHDLKGEIYVQSRVNKGTTFTCLLPAQSTNGKTMKHHQNLASTFETNSKTFKILLVEDELLAQKIVISLLEKTYDCHIDLAKNGKEAIHLIEQNHYDLVFMDLGLPDLSGYEISEKIRAIKGEVLPIIALTAHNTSNAKKAAKKVGMNQFITKPITATKIEKIFNRWLKHIKTKKADLVKE